MLAEGASASSFYERLVHFSVVLNPLNCLASSGELDAARDLILRLRVDHPPAPPADRAAFERAAALYESAYHPDTGERIPLVGRMCFQAPGAAPLTAAMLVCHRSLPATLALQWVNQSFMAVCNWSNRNARVAADGGGGGGGGGGAVLGAYLGATFGSLLTAFSLKRCLPKSWSILVPAAAISVASLVNVPCMRSAELRDGLVVEDADGVPLETRSHAAACYAIGAVTVSRILLAPRTSLPFPRSSALLSSAATRGRTRRRRASRSRSTRASASPPSRSRRPSRRPSRRSGPRSPPPGATPISGPRYRAAPSASSSTRASKGASPSHG
jgi:hypothetical protein